MNDNNMPVFLASGFNDTDETFERQVIDCLNIIFDTELIKKIKETSNISLLQIHIDNIYKDPKLYENFIKDIIKFSREKERNGNTNLSSLKNQIITDLINMYVYLNVVKELPNDEIQKFETQLKRFKISKKIEDYWRQKKKILQNDITLVEINPVFLEEKRYEQVGLKLKEVKKMDNRMIKKLNDYISKNIPERKPSNLILDSGSGFVNAILITCTAITVISLGIIYFILRK